jgi:hypothetical protein
VGGEYAFLKQAPDGSIWLSDAGGSRRVTGYPDPTKLIAGPERIRKPPSGFGNFTFAPNGALWAASGLGVYRSKSVEQYKVDEPLSTADAEAFTVNHGLSSSVAVDLLIDREGSVWMTSTERQFPISTSSRPRRNTNLTPGSFDRMISANASSKSNFDSSIVSLELPFRPASKSLVSCANTPCKGAARIAPVSFPVGLASKTQHRSPPCVASRGDAINNRDSQ